MTASIHKIELRWPSGANRPASANRGRTSAPPRPLLDHFYAGPENRLAAFVCSGRESIAERGNPLLLVGPSGAGKSALAALLAANEADYHQRGTCLQMTAVDFARRYAEAVEGDDLDHFRRPLDQAEVLLIDDVHLIASKFAAQEELAARLEGRTDASRVTILTCRRIPTEIRNFRPLLSSRMLPGLMIPLALPEPAARRAILRALAEDAQMELAEDLLDLLCAGLPPQLPASRLAAAITHVRVWSQNAECEPNVAAVQSAIDSTAGENEPSIPEIANAVARRFKLKTSDLKGPTRRQQVVRARALAMFLGRKLTDRSLQQIGNYFGGRDHTTVLHACRKTESLLALHPDLSRAADEVSDSLQTSPSHFRESGTR